MYVQRRIKSVLTSEKEAQLDMICRLKCLEDELERYGHTHNFTRLIPDLKGVDPDDSFSSVPYEKGFNFLWHLATVVGGPEKFAPFVKHYVKTFASKPLTSEDFRQCFLRWASQTDAADAVSTIDWDAWLLSPGMPPVANKFDDTLAKVCAQLKSRWMKSGAKDASPKDIDGWSTLQTLIFLDSLQKDDAATITDAATLREMDAAYNFTKRENAEIRFRWQTLCVRAEMEEIVPHVIRLITEQGRMKFTRPLYRELFKSKMAKEIAVATFKKHRSSYHPICAKMVARDLCVADEESSTDNVTSSVTGTRALAFFGVGVLVAAAALVFARRRRRS